MELTLLLLSLAVAVQSWPQIPDDVGNSRRETSVSPIPLTLARSLPVIEDTQASMGTLNVRRARSLPVVEDTEASMGTLNVRRHSKKRHTRREIPGFVGLEVQEREKRGLPSVDEGESVGTLPVASFDKREDDGEDEWLQDEDPDAPMHASRGLPVVEETESMGTLPVRDATPGYVTLPVVHGEHPGLVGRAVEMQLENRSDVAYYAQLNIGSPAQQVYAQLDTGSFELWINPDCTKLQGGDKTFCQAVGEYDPSLSKTSRRTGSSKKLNYGIGAAEIDYVKDDIALSDSITLKQVQFGVATKTQDQFAGILGLGYGNGAVVKYDNFIDNLKKQGVTKTRAYGVALGSKEEGGGVISFGAADTSKYSGRLAALPVIPADKAPDGVPRFWVDMKSMGLTTAGDGKDKKKSKTKKWSGSSMPVFLDTGATLTLMPPSLAASIAADFGAEELDEHGFYAVDCAYMAKEGSVDFEFAGVTVKVPFREVIRQVMSSPPSCYLGIMPSKRYALLGDTFMRSAYAVFDQDSDTVFLAQYQNCGSSLKTISKSSDIKGMVGSCSASQDSKDSKDEGIKDKEVKDKEIKDKEEIKDEESNKDVLQTSLLAKPSSTTTSSTTASTTITTTASHSATKSTGTASAVSTETLSDPSASPVVVTETKVKGNDEEEEEESEPKSKSDHANGLGSEDSAGAALTFSAAGLGLVVAAVVIMML